MRQAARLQTLLRTRASARPTFARNAFAALAFAESLPITGMTKASVAERTGEFHPRDAKTALAALRGFIPPTPRFPKKPTHLHDENTLR
jgi:hypothetical protein